MVKLDDSAYREEDIKSLFLGKEHVLGELGKTGIIFEKGIMRTSKQTSNTIVDIMVFSELQGIIGIEIKTERDSTRRLTKQLRDYSRVCDLVYVLCHDNHVEKVEAIIKRYKFSHVGILAYTQFKEEFILGVYRKPVQSPTKSINQAMDMIHKHSIVKMLGTFKDPNRRVREELGIEAYSTPPRSGGAGYYSLSGFNDNMSKALLIGTLIKKLGGPKEANRVLCNVFINNAVNPDANIKLRHFNHSMIEEVPHE